MSWAEYDDAMGRSRFLASQYGEELRMRNAHPLQRLRTMTQLNTATRETELAVVRYCREQGASWADIGRALGVTRQAARQRFLSALPDPITRPNARHGIFVNGTVVWVEDAG